MFRTLERKTIKEINTPRYVYLKKRNLKREF